MVITMESWREELYHHGILGQRWGKKNGPPYPLDASDHSSSEKKAGWRKSLDGDNKSKSVLKRKTEPVKSKSEKKGLTDKQKTAIKVGATVGVTVLAAYAGYRLYKSGKLDAFLKNGKNEVSDILGYSGDVNISFIKGPDFKKRENFKLDESTIQSCCASINESNSRTNCGSCAVVSILNTEGNDLISLSEVPESMRRVKPDGSLGNGYDPNKLLSAFKGSKKEDLMGNFLGPRDACKKVTERLEGFGEGAYGILWTEHMKGVGGYNRPGHYVGWRILNGKLHILEGQPSSEGIVWKDLYNDIGRNMEPDTLSWARLDGLEIDKELIKLIVKNRS